MAGDALNAPLGGPRPHGEESLFPYGLAALAGFVVLGFGMVAFIVVTDDGAGGLPVASARIEPLAKLVASAPARTVDADTTASIATSSTLAPRATAEDVEGRSGVKVVRPAGAAPSGALIIQVPERLDVALNPAPDDRVGEKGRFGLLPKVGVDGSRPADIYARPIITGGRLPAGAPRIALLVGGMGLDGAATLEAASSLPGAVTFGFAPYGPDLAAQVARTRGAGHEVVLQVPMEGFDGPAGMPGPHSLLVEGPTTRTIEDLHWQMGRFPGYVGIAGFLGARFAADEAAMQPVLRDVATRGLLYVDDASAPRSLAATLAPQVGLPIVAADVALDRDPGAAAVNAALSRLEALARQRGLAVGVASGAKDAVAPIAAFARGLEARGIALVPISAVAAVPVGSNARARP